MSLVVPNDGDVLMLKYIVNQLSQDGGSAPVGGERLLRLFSNNLVPAKSTVIGDISETTISGYTAVTLSGVNWTVSTSTAGTNSAVYSEQTFNFGTAATIYGYYVTTTEMTPSLLWVERFSTAPFTLPAGGGEIAITPRITLD
jgi:hypothetical protein